MYVKKVIKIEEEAPTIAKQTCKLRYAEEEKKSKEKKQAGESQNEEKKKRKFKEAQNLQNVKRTCKLWPDCKPDLQEGLNLQVSKITAFSTYPTFSFQFFDLQKKKKKPSRWGWGLGLGRGWRFL